MTARLVCINGSLAGKSVILEQGKDRKIRIGTKEHAPLLAFSHEGVCWHVSCDKEFDCNGEPSQASILHDGDEITCADNTFRFESDEIVSVDYSAETREESHDYEEEVDASGKRQRRRISASHKAVLQSPNTQKPGLLERVGQAFKRKDERLQKLQELERQRQDMLVAAGRFMLEHQGGIGLPDGALVQLFKGETLSLSLDNLKKQEVEQFRKLRERMLFLDADIDACRIEAGLEQEERNVLSELHLQADHEAEEENAFQAMDAVATVEQEYDLQSHSEDQQFDDIGTAVYVAPKQESSEEVLSEEDDPTDIIRREPEPQKTSSSGRRRSGVSRRRRRTR